MVITRRESSAAHRSQRGSPRTCLSSLISPSRHVRLSGRIGNVELTGEPVTPCGNVLLYLRSVGGWVPLIAVLIRAGGFAWIAGAGSAVSAHPSSSGAQGLSSTQMPKIIVGDGVWWPSFSYDRTLIAFSHDMSGNLEIYLINADGPDCAS